MLPAFHFHGKLEPRSIAYNWCVDKPAMRKPPGGAAPVLSLSEVRKRALRAEAVGIIVIALTIFLITVLRYGAHINWSAR